MARRRIAVLGAGPAGLGAAMRLVDLGVDVTVFEASSVVGGLARTVCIGGISADLGPHVFQGGTAPAVEMWTRFLGPNVHEVPLRRGISLNGAILDHPPVPADLLRKLPLAQLTRCVSGLVRAKLDPRHSTSDDSEAWIVSRYGRGLYDTIARDYIEKLWGRSGREVHAGFARALFGEAARVTELQSVLSSATTFPHPDGGTGAVWERIAHEIRAAGTLRLSTPVEGLVSDGPRVIGIRANGVDARFDGVVSSLPLPRLLQAVGAPPDVNERARSLSVRNVVIAHLVVEGGIPLDRAWIFIADPDLAVGRITDGRAWRGGDRGVVAMEFWCNSADPVWTDPAEVIAARAAGELQQSGVLPGVRVIDTTVTRLAGVLPVPTLSAPTTLAAIREFIDSREGLWSIGRHGSFSFNSMADSIAEGIVAAEHAAAA